MQKLLGPNWQARLSSIAGTLMAILTFLSTVSYDTSPLALIIPPEYKGTIGWIAGLATAILWLWNGARVKDKEVTGGSKPVLSTNLPETFISDGVEKKTSEATNDELAQIKSLLGLTH